MYLHSQQFVTLYNLCEIGPILTRVCMYIRSASLPAVYVALIWLPTHIEERIRALLIQQSLSAPAEMKKADWLIQINGTRYHKFVTRIYPEI